jgi:hypothetical protein
MALVPTPLENDADPLPANVLTVTTGEGRRSALVTANVAAVRLALVETSLEPHDTITPEGELSLKEDASHFTQEETVKGEEPTGREDNVGVDTYDPLEKTNDELGKDDPLDEYVRPPLELTILANADTLSL